MNLLLTRTFFSIQRPWITTRIAALNLTVNVAVSVALYKPFGIAGIVIGTGVSSAVMTAAQMYALRHELHGRLEVRRTAIVTAQITLAAALLAVVSYAVWDVLDRALGRDIPAQIISVGGGLAAGAVAYGLTVHVLRIPEARQIERLVAGRISSARGR